MTFSFAGRTALLAVLAFFQGAPQIPAPQGLVNDFAGVISAESAARMERIAQDVRDKTKGEMAIVTLGSVGDRAATDVAREIGRQWKVGNLAAIGDRSRNAGVVILLVPKESSADGKGYCRVETGQGTEGFITDATAGDICREATPAFAQKDYSTGLELVTLRVAQRFAQEFNVSLDTSLQAPVIVQQQPQRTTSGGSTRISPVAILFILFILFSLFGRRRSGCSPWLLLGLMNSGGGRGGWGGGGGFGGGGGGGGFGGFGGGGGFSGGGGGSSW